MSEREILELQKKIEALKKEKAEKWELLTKKYHTWEFYTDGSKNPRRTKNVAGRVLYECLVNEKEEGKDQDQWIKNIELCFDKMYIENEELEPQYRMDSPSFKTTILGIMITWQQDHATVEKFLRGKLDFHKVIDGEMYMNKWAWGQIDGNSSRNYNQEAKPVFLAVLFGKTKWLRELLRLGAKTDYGMWWNMQNSGCTRMSPQELNNELMIHYDKHLDDRLKTNTAFEDYEVRKIERKRIREEIKKLLLVGSATKTTINDSSNPQLKAFQPKLKL